MAPSAWKIKYKGYDDAEKLLCAVHITRSTGYMPR
jgi:hypothetical protein